MFGEEAGERVNRAGVALRGVQGDFFVEVWRLWIIRIVWRVEPEIEVYSVQSKLFFI
jgi:hypothetical protein